MTSSSSPALERGLDTMLPITVNWAGLSGTIQPGASLTSSTAPLCLAGDLFASEDTASITFTLDGCQTVILANTFGVGLK